MQTPRYNPRFRRFVRDVFVHTPVVKVSILLIVSWIAFSTGVYYAEQQAEAPTIETFGEALYWGIAAFSTAGIADTPSSGLAQLIGGTWIVIGSILFFGSIVATVTTYFMRPVQRPHRRIIDTIEYNLEQVTDLSVDELELLQETVDSLIQHVEHLRKTQDGDEDKSDG